MRGLAVNDNQGGINPLIQLAAMEAYNERWIIGLVMKNPWIEPNWWRVTAIFTRKTGETV